MKRYLQLCIVSLLGILPIMAQSDSIPQKAWKFSGTFGLNATATGLLNWTGGGKSTLSALSFAKLNLLYNKGRVAWETRLDTDFGMLWADQDEDPVKKTSDNIKLMTKLGWEFRPSWFLTVEGNFQSQYAVGRKMRKGYDPPISMWLAPAYTDLSIGIDWKKSVGPFNFSVYLSPLAELVVTVLVSDKANETLSEEYRENVPSEPDYDFRREMQMRYATFKVVRNAEGHPEIDWRNYRTEFGFLFRAYIACQYRKLAFDTTFAAFTPYQGKGYNMKQAYEAAHPNEKWDIYYHYSNMNRLFGNFDVNWDLNFSYQFTKVLNITLSTRLQYYSGLVVVDKPDDCKERVQLKAILGLGLGYRF